MKKALILINGYKRSGKDYTGELITNLIGRKKCNIVSFAEPIKKIIACTFDISLNELEKYKNTTESFGIETKVYSKCQPSETLAFTNFRAILQKFGTEAMKPQFGNNVWAKLCIKKVRKSKKKINLITDFRFLTEFEEAKKYSNKGKYKLITINVFNNDIDNTDMHASESELKDNKFKFDFYIDNTSQPDITKKVEEILNSL